MYTQVKRKPLKAAAKDSAECVGSKVVVKPLTNEQVTLMLDGLDELNGEYGAPSLIVTEPAMVGKTGGFTGETRMKMVGMREEKKAEEDSKEEEARQASEVNVSRSMSFKEKTKGLSIKDIGFSLAKLDYDCSRFRRKMKPGSKFELSMVDDFEQCLIHGSQKQIDSLSKFCRMANESVFIQQLFLDALIRRRKVSKQCAEMEQKWHDHIESFKVEHIEKAVFLGRELPAAKVTIKLNLDFTQEFGDVDDPSHEFAKEKFAELFRKMMSEITNMSTDMIQVRSLEEGCIHIVIQVALLLLPMGIGVMAALIHKIGWTDGSGQVIQKDTDGRKLKQGDIVEVKISEDRWEEGIVDGVVSTEGWIQIKFKSATVRALTKKKWWGKAKLSARFAPRDVTVRMKEPYEALEGVDVDTLISQYGEEGLVSNARVRPTFRA